MTAYKLIRAKVLLLGLISTAFIGSCGSSPALAQISEPLPHWERLANAIYKAEGGAKTRHPYGILAKYKHTTPRQACLNTIKNQWKRHKEHDCGKEYLACLRDRYCPLGASNDPRNLNRNWLKNVRRFLNSDSLVLN